MLTNYDAHKIVIYKYTLIMFTEHVFINYDFASIIICEHDKYVFTKHKFVGIRFVSIINVYLQSTILWAL